MTHHYVSLYDHTTLAITPNTLTIQGADCDFTIAYSPLALRDIIEGGDGSQVDGLATNYTRSGYEFWVELPDGDAPEICSDSFTLRTEDIMRIKSVLTAWGN